MGNSAVINAIGLSDYALQPIIGSKSSFQHVLNFAHALPGVERVICLVSTGHPCAETANIAGADIIARDNWTVLGMFNVIKDELNGTEHAFYFYGDSPLLDIKLSTEMYENHKRYFARYTFADGYPYGLTPEILAADLFPALIQLEGEQNRKIERDAVFSVIQKDINAFEIETTLSPKDLRLLRVRLAADTKRNTNQLRSIIDKGGKDAESVSNVLEKYPEILRTLPAYINIQITGGCYQSCMYCPYPVMEPNLLNNNDFMSMDSFTNVIEQVSTFCNDAVIGLGLFGEPSRHPDIEAVINAVLDKPGLSLLIETSGLGWNKDIFESFSGRKELSWIVSLDSLDQKVYNTLRGDGFFEALETSKKLLKLFPESAWVQAVRMKENEEILESFYREWKKETGQVIIQKYDTFCGVLPERKVADLSPVIRFPCWHIKRDISVRLDGTVPLCREDVNNQHILGNIFSENIETIWDRGTSVYLEHIKEKYNSQCVNCDEYYTYNF